MTISSIFTQIFPPKPTFTESNLPSQKGKVFIVTGGNSGVGYELCKILYTSGATIYMATRSEQRALSAIQAITQATPRATTPGILKYLALDLNDLTKVKAAAANFATQESKLNVLWNNAGLGAFRVKPGARTAQGLEAMIGLHCVATLLFTQLLKPQLMAAVKASAGQPGSVRVLWTSSISTDETSPPNGINFDLLAMGTEDAALNYAVSKAGSWMLAREMARRWGSDGIVTAALNPGNVRANSYEGVPGSIMYFLKWILSDPKFGAYTELFAGLSPDVMVENNGGYFIPWGRVRTDEQCPRQDIIRAMAPEEDGGLGYCNKLWCWCEEQWKLHV